MRAWLVPALMSMLAAGAGAASTKPLKLRGYVTEIRSQTSFDIDDYRVNRDHTVALEIEKPGAPDLDAPAAADLRIGSEVEIRGDYDADTHVLRATSVKVFPGETRRVRRTAILEQQPQLRNHGAWWDGTLRVDGQTLHVDEATKVSIVPNKTPRDAELPAASEQIHPNMYVSYEGARENSGAVRVARIEFRDNQLTKGEMRMFKMLAPQVTPPKASKPGQLKIARVGRYKLAPDEAARQYVERLGASLIPALQRNLAAADPGKIPFRFYLIERKSPNAFALANGTVVVHSGLFAALEDEAQLAFVLGHEIAHATQEHTARQMEFHKKKRLALRLAAVAASQYGAYTLGNILALVSDVITNGYERHLENQADRLGMEYMLAAGYDPREAPRAWKSLSIKHGDYPANVFWSNHDSNATRRSYLMAELSNHYSAAAFAGTRRDSAEFHQVASRLER